MKSVMRILIILALAGIMAGAIYSEYAACETDSECGCTTDCLDAKE